MARYTLAFLDAYLNHDAAALARGALLRDNETRVTGVFTVIRGQLGEKLVRGSNSRMVFATSEMRDKACYVLLMWALRDRDESRSQMCVALTVGRFSTIGCAIKHTNRGIGP
jgi:hypothetical protein